MRAAAARTRGTGLRRRRAFDVAFAFAFVRGAVLAFGRGWVFAVATGRATSTRRRPFLSAARRRHVVQVHLERGEGVREAAAHEAERAPLVPRDDASGGVAREVEAAAYGLRPRVDGDDEEVAAGAAGADEDPAPAADEARGVRPLEHRRERLEVGVGREHGGAERVRDREAHPG